MTIEDATIWKAATSIGAGVVLIIGALWAALMRSHSSYKKETDKRLEALQKSSNECQEDRLRIHEKLAGNAVEAQQRISAAEHHAASLLKSLEDCPAAGCPQRPSLRAALAANARANRPRMSKPPPPDEECDGCNPSPA